VEDRTRNPVFAYKGEHTIDIDDELITYLMENTLTIGVYGKVEQKKKAKPQIEDKDSRNQ